MTLWVQQDMRRVARCRAMTLIELIMVLALLSMVAALAAPSLAPFFRGRGLQEEGRRMLALTRYARSEAVSQCVPMELWIDSMTGEYGLNAQAGYESENGNKEVRFRLNDGLIFVVGETQLDENLIARIVFQPDGVVDQESPKTFIIQNETGSEVFEIAQMDLGLGYEIRDTQVLPRGDRTESANR